MTIFNKTKRKQKQENEKWKQKEKEKTKKRNKKHENQIKKHNDQKVPEPSGNWKNQRENSHYTTSKNQKFQNTTPKTKLAKMQLITWFS
jgi:hypothetical protein